MIDYLKEIGVHTNGLGFLDVVKLSSNSDETSFMSITDDKSVFLTSVFKITCKEFNGICGLEEIGRLTTILNNPEYKENASVSIKENNGNPVSLTISNSSGDCINEYRFRAKELIESKLPNKTRKTVRWDISFEPNIAAIQKLKYQTQSVGNSSLTIKTNGSDLMFSLGDVNTYTGQFVFSSGINGSIRTPRKWPLVQIYKILTLGGDKKIDICDDGIMQITVTTGMAEHQYNVFATME